ncbi:hypothetical protein DsansV1_C38g0235291 [Dioscorea sansibarensis]
MTIEMGSSSMLLYQTNSYTYSGPMARTCLDRLRQWLGRRSRSRRPCV